MAMSVVPKKIGIGVRVEEKKKDGQIGTVLNAVGPKTWNVEFDGGTTEHKTSQSLKIYKAAYTNLSTPHKKTAATVIRAAPKTGRRVEDEDHVEYR